MNSISRIAFEPGQVIATWRVAYWHVGIVTERWSDGEQVVISCSGARKMVVEEKMSDFAQGLPVQVRAKPSLLAAPLVIKRAREKIGQSYRLLDWNCEHFVCYAFDVEPASPQLAFALAAIFGLLLARG